MFHRFNTGSSGPPLNPNPPVNPPRLPNSDYSCVVATTGDWRLARCTDQHHVVCQSGRPVYSQFVSDRFSFLLLRVLCGQADKQTNRQTDRQSENTRMAQ